MPKTRISYGDRLLMGSIGNLEGLRRRLPSFESYDKARVQEAISTAGRLKAQLESMLGSGKGGPGSSPEDITATIAAQSATRSAGQQRRMDACGD